MNLALYARSNELMTAAVNGEIDLDDLESELLAMIAELDLHDDTRIEHHVGGALLALAEMDRGDRDEMSVRQALRDLVSASQPVGASHRARG